MNYLCETIIFGRAEQRQLVCVMTSAEVNLGTTNKIVMVQN